MAMTHNLQRDIAFTVKGSLPFGEQWKTAGYGYVTVALALALKQKFGVPGVLF
jgi:hypothetical protein